MDSYESRSAPTSVRAFHFGPEVAQSIAAFTSAGKALPPELAERLPDGFEIKSVGYAFGGQTLNCGDFCVQHSDGKREVVSGADMLLRFKRDESGSAPAPVPA